MILCLDVTTGHGSGTAKGGYGKSQYQSPSNAYKKGSITLC